jgi:putative ABC transport system substrate-binding protein
MSARLLLVVVFTAGLLTASPSAEAQPSERMWRIGVLATGTPASTSTRFEIFRQALQDLGYVEGRNLTIETRWSDGTPERLSDDAA